MNISILLTAGKKSPYASAERSVWVSRFLFLFLLRHIWLAHISYFICGYKGFSKRMDGQIVYSGPCCASSLFVHLRDAHTVYSYHWAFFIRIAEVKGNLSTRERNTNTQHTAFLKIPHFLSKCVSKTVGEFKETLEKTLAHIQHKWAVGVIGTSFPLMCFHLSM